METTGNSIGYGIPRDTSVVVNRTTKTVLFTHNEATAGDITTCVFPTGTEYIDTRRSVLSFELETPTEVGTAYGFGVHGSACNLIKSITIFSRSGEELCRTDSFNLLSNMMLQFQYNRDWFQRQGQMMWYGSRIFATPQTCVIPMYILSPLFGYGKLLPSALVSGMRVEIKLEDSINTMIAVGTGPPMLVGDPGLSPTYTIRDIQFNVESVKLGDGIQRAMDEQMATRGVELVYSGWHHEHLDPGHGMTNTTQVTISDSYVRALRAFARVRPRKATDDIKDEGLIG